MFFISAVVIVIAGSRLVHYCDIISRRTGLGHIWAGAILIALADGQPELFTGLAAVVRENAPKLALGNVFGSVMFNLLIIAILDFKEGKGSILRRVDRRLILWGVASVALAGLSAAGIFLGEIAVGRLGLFTILLGCGYVITARFLFRRGEVSPEATRTCEVNPVPAQRTGLSNGVNLRTAVGGYVVLTTLILASSITLARSSKEIALLTGMGETFVGTLLLAVVTSLPELITTTTAVRRGFFSMAIGTIFGANLFNMFIIFVCDIFCPYPILSAGCSLNLFSIVVGMVMGSIVIAGIALHTKKSFLRLGWNSATIAVIYVLASYFIFSRQF